MEGGGVRGEDWHRREVLKSKKTSVSHNASLVGITVLSSVMSLIVWLAKKMFIASLRRCDCFPKF